MPETSTMRTPGDTVAIVTGADVNLGRAMATALLRSGAKVVLTSLSQEATERVIVDSAAPRENALAVAADLGDEAGRDAILSQTFERFGRVDMLVNNAAVTPETFWPDWLVTGEPRQWTLDADFYRRFLEIDCVAPHILMSAVIPGMVERGWGRIINVTTSLDTMLRFWPYGSAKAALEAQTAVLAEQLTGTGVSAVAMNPGGFTKAEPLSLKGGKTVTPQFTPDIMGPPICWLASSASDGITGKRIVAARWHDGETGEAAWRDAVMPIAWSEYGLVSARPAIG